MINAKELRIGNLVWTKSRPTSINQNNEVLTIVCMVRVEDCDEYTPIPLTEEWLVKFGFEKNEDGNYDKSIEDSILFEIRIGKDGAFGAFSSIDTSVEGYFEFFDSALPTSIVKNIHQLQNLYFALTGEELTLNEA
jgi:hypothetical protein